MKRLFWCIGLLLITSLAFTQEDFKDFLADEADSILITEFENEYPEKVLHAEPLYVDLIRDLGARKGEREWNVAFGLTDKKSYDEYEALVEYEWAPIDRLGLELELPFLFYYQNNENMATPKSKLSSFKFAAQYSFFVSKALKTSMAIAYLNEVEFTSFSDYGNKALIEGNRFNPFFIAAKRWGQNFHTLVYTGPQISYHYADKSYTSMFEVNTNFHYMIDGTKNFIGVEFNKELYKDDFDMTIRPQMRLEINDHVLIGIVTGINVVRAEERFSSFFRLIYEPKH